MEVLPLCKSCFQYTGGFLIELINEKAFSLATNLSIVPLELSLTVLAVKVTGLILCITKLLMNVKGTHTQIWQKIDNLYLL